MMRKIEIELADRDVGTKAKVIERKWFRTKVTDFVCIQSGKWGGAYWANQATGESAGWDLNSELNVRAQNAVGLARVSGLLK